MGRHHTVDHKDYTYDNTMRWTVNPAEEFIRAVAASIISQAVEDWIGLIYHMERVRTWDDPKRISDYKQQSCGASNFIEIRRFFNSDYGEMLCGVLDLDPGIVLQRMERWLYEYREDGVLPKRIHQQPRKEGRRCSTRKKSTASSTCRRSPKAAR